MNYINILAGCNSTLGTCCKDYGLVKILAIYDNVFSLIQILVPILLLLSASAQLFRMLRQPEEKKHIKSLRAKFHAAAIVFVIPIFVNLVIAIATDNSDLQKYETLACLKEAKHTVSSMNKQGNYIKKNSSNKGSGPMIIDPSKYKGTDGNPNASEGTYSTNSSSDDSSTNSSDTRNYAVTTTSDGKKVVSYAKQFLGKAYQYGGQWNGSPTYTPTDCSGFVKGVYAHFGYNIPRVAGASYYNSSSALKKVSNSNLQAGDLVLYSGHVAMLTGNGKEIIHASNRKDGIKLTSTYAYRGGNILGFYRVKGIS
ncbi:MAG: C40 family peptidase [Bacilli bacterium]|nr:C40 family peptidase [Bacilli bacterium]